MATKFWQNRQKYNKMVITAVVSDTSMQSFVLR